MVNKFIPLNTVLSDVASAIPTEYWNESDAVEWAFKASRAMNSVERLATHITLLNVENFRTKLPDDYVQVELMAYKLDTLTTEDELETIMRDIGIDNDTYYAGFTDDGIFLSEYRPLRASKSKFTLSVTCEESLNIYLPSEHTYSINENGTVITSFEKGTIALVYRRYPTDCGDYMIPDDEAFITALKSYILMRIWEYRYNIGEDIAERRYKDYRADWQVFAQKAKGSLKMPNIDRLENLRQTRMRLLEKSREYYKGFDNRREENLTF